MKIHNFIISGGDTDAINFSKEDGSKFSKEELDELFKELNEISPEFMTWEMDGLYEKVLVLRAKNYVLYDGKKLLVKGSGLRIPNKEIALKECTDRFINSLLELSSESLIDIYNSYIQEIHDIKNVSRWTSKKTVTDAVLNPERANEQKVFDALEGTDIQEGDRFRFYFKFDGVTIKIDINPKTGKQRKTKKREYSLKLEQNWNNDHAIDKLLEKLYKNIKIFENVIDIKQFPNYNLTRNKKALSALLENK